MPSDDSRDDTAKAEAQAQARAERFGRLPDAPSPESFVVEIPAIPDDRPQAAPPAPAAAPELIAAKQIADARAERRR